MSTELIARVEVAFPKMKSQLAAPPAKLYELKSDAPAVAVQIESIADLDTRVQHVVLQIQRATFTGAGDKEKVPALYKNYVSQIATSLQKALAFASRDAGLQEEHAMASGLQPFPLGPPPQPSLPQLLTSSGELLDEEMAMLAIRRLNVR